MRKFTLVKTYPDDKLLWNNIKGKTGVFLTVLFSRKFSKHVLFHCYPEPCGPNTLHWPRRL